MVLITFHEVVVPVYLLKLYVSISKYMQYFEFDPLYTFYGYI